MTVAAGTLPVKAAPVPNCYLCGSPGIAIQKDLQDTLCHVPGRWCVRECERCGLVWLDPRPLPSELAKIYVNYPTHRPSVPNRTGNPPMRTRLKRAILGYACGYPLEAASVTERALAQIVASIPPIRDVVEGSVMWLPAAARGRVLDVGCGNGGFLARMRGLGWETYGVEPDPAAVDAAQRLFDLDVTCATLDEADFPNDRFDVVTLNHVIEHVADPVGLLLECLRVLRPNGQLIVVTPNVESWGRRYFGPSWRGWEVPRHFFLFNVRTLGECASRSGFARIQVRTTAKGARFIWASSGSAPQQDHSTWSRGLAGHAVWFMEHIAAQRHSVGEELVLVAAKPPEPIA